MRANYLRFKTRKRADFTEFWIYCETHFYWPAITRIETTNGYLLFFMGTILATYIPQVNVESKTFTTFKESAIQFWQSAKDNPLEPLPL